LITRLERPTSGDVFYQDTDVTGLSDRALRRFRREVQPVFQDPLTALNPRWTVRRLITEPLQIHGERDAGRRVGEGLRDVGLGKELMPRRPRDLSGGERQGRDRAGPRPATVNARPRRADRIGGYGRQAHATGPAETTAVRTRPYLPIHFARYPHHRGNV